MTTTQQSDPVIAAIVPARGGSKGVPRKNLRPLDGRPLISYTLDTLRELAPEGIIPLISTDDEEISRYCAAQGFNSGYRRPLSLGADDSSIIDVVLDAVQWHEASTKVRIDAVLLLQPTSPLRQITELHAILEAFRSKPERSIASVVTMREHPFDCVNLRPDGTWEFLAVGKPDVPNRQGYSSQYYFIDGSIYIAPIRQIRDGRKFVIPGCTTLFPLKMKWPIDIDYVEDFQMAEAFVRPYVLGPFEPQLPDTRPHDK